MTKSTTPQNEKTPSQKPLPSSHGPNSQSVTPKDVSRTDAAAKDVTERNVSGSQDELLDDAVDLTFPASDPVSVGQSTRIERGKEHRH